MKILTLFLAILALEVAPVMGATTQNVVVTATVPSILSLETSAATVTMSLADSDYDAAGLASFPAVSAHNLLVRSNRAWEVKFKATAASFSFTPTVTGDTVVKPSTDLSIRTGGNAYAGVTTSDQVLKTGQPGATNAAGNTFAVDYKLNSNLSTDKPGSYSLTVTYTVTTP
jgi:hypothetical protein